MINPNKIHRAKAIVTAMTQSRSCYNVRLSSNGALLEGFDLPKNIEIGDLVNIQAQYSIILDTYVVKTINKRK